MRDLYNYPYPRGYGGASGLYNLAWAQAVQNKPLNEVLGEFKKEDTTTTSTGDENNSTVEQEQEKDEQKQVLQNSVTNNNNGGSDDSEREEGELEEGEMIDYEADNNVINDNQVDEFCGLEMEEDQELENQVSSIRKVLHNVTVAEANKSFDIVCARLRSSLESLRELVLHTWFPSKDDLIQQSFLAIQCVYSVYSSFGPSSKDQNKDRMSRLLTFVMGLSSNLFTAEQRKEVEGMIAVVNPPIVSVKPKARDRQEELPVTEKAILTDSNTLTVNTGDNGLEYLKKGGFEYSVEKTNHNDILTDAMKQFPSNIKGRSSFGPLLDLHKVHDEDSLPSPTTKSIPVSPFFETSVPKVVHPYETDAVKAVSSYQQRFGRSTFLALDRLPSPTPSGDGNDRGGDDPNEEVSSYTHLVDRNTTNVTKPEEPVVSCTVYTTTTSSSSVQGVNGTRSAKSRDPRLRHLNPNFSSLDLSFCPSPLVVASSATSKLEPLGEIMNTKKVKALEVPSLDGHGHGPAPKRSRNGLETEEVSTNENSIKTGLGTSTTILGTQHPKSVSSGSSALNLSVNLNTSPQSVMNNVSGTPSPSLELLLKNIIKEQKQLQSGSHSTSSSISSIAPLPTTVSISATVGQTSSGLSSQDESAKPRMKPRDPRRALHANTCQRTGNSLTEQPKVNGTTQGLQDNVNGTSPSVVLPDITKQFTKNLRNIADIISAPQRSPQVNVPVSSSVGAQGQKNWGDVEHLFDGYDDQQKAAIQQERSRRLDEQKKMFAARKLCLVLDLDHTLLNSAKFSEVDPVHDEILRKKEEQDREKPHRHLFRFPHMAMWTKLRPGIWNFLEKASKLYELHLYTMGNKLYATEMAKVLDPKGNLFAGRVISRGDDGDPIDGDERVPKSKDLEGVLGMESSVVVIDDSARVWPHNKLNLIVVERYTYFPCSRRQFGLPGPSLLEIDHDERPEEGTLASSLAVIQRIHQNFFAHKTLDEVDVRSILAAEQRKILAGCRIVFSRVIPVGEASPHLHPLWQTAQQFGAVCTNHIDDQVTHVVANSLGTDKVNWALAKGKFVVHPGWVEASALLYRRANEQDFAVKS